MISMFDYFLESRILSKMNFERRGLIPVLFDIINNARRNIMLLLWIVNLINSFYYHDNYY